MTRVRQTRRLWRAAIATAIIFIAFCVALAVIPSTFKAEASSHSVNWPMFDYNSTRSGFDPSEKIISLSNIKHLHRRWVAQLGDTADATPIFMSTVRLPDGRVANMLFETARNGTTYGLDAQSGSIVWRHATSGPNITTSTPVADPSGQSLYAPGVDGFVHKLSASTGAELREKGFPVRITWMSDIEKHAAAMNLANGYLYAVTSGYLGDAGHYDGHLVTIALNDGRVHVLNSLCDNIARLLKPGDATLCPESKSGIWARAGAVVDPDPAMHGQVYLATGNGRFNASNGGHDYGDAVLAIRADGSKIEDYFAPSYYALLEDTDMDLGSTAPALLPRDPASNTPLMAIQGGKDGVIRLLDRTHLGGIGGELQDLLLGHGIFSAPAVWRDGSGTTRIYYGTSAAVTALRVVTDPKGQSRLQRAWTADAGGTSPVVANGIVFVATDGEVNAFAARTGEQVWSSRDASAGGTIGGIHWESPIVVNGCVYISDQDAHLTAYGL